MRSSSRRPDHAKLLHLAKRLGHAECYAGIRDMINEGLRRNDHKLIGERALVKMASESPGAISRKNQRRMLEAISKRIEFVFGSLEAAARAGVILDVFDDRKDPSQLVQPPAARIDTLSKLYFGLPEEQWRAAKAMLPTALLIEEVGRSEHRFDHEDCHTIARLVATWLDCCPPLQLNWMTYEMRHRIYSIGERFFIEARKKLGAQTADTGIALQHANPCNIVGERDWGQEFWSNPSGVHDSEKILPTIDKNWFTFLTARTTRGGSEWSRTIQHRLNVARLHIQNRAGCFKDACDELVKANEVLSFGSEYNAAHYHVVSHHVNWRGDKSLAETHLNMARDKYLEMYKGPHMHVAACEVPLAQRYPSSVNRSRLADAVKMLFDTPLNHIGTLNLSGVWSGSELDLTGLPFSQKDYLFRESKRHGGIWTP